MIFRRILEVSINFSEIKFFLYRFYHLPSNLKQILRLKNSLRTCHTVVKGGGILVPDRSTNKEQVGDCDQNTGFEGEFPSVEVDNCYDEDERSEQHRARNDEPRGVDHNCFGKFSEVFARWWWNDAGDKHLSGPWESETQQDIENVGTDRVGYSHVSHALSGYENGRDRIRNGGTGCQKGQTHNRIWNSHSKTTVGDHPHHNVRVGGDPNSRHEETDEVEVFLFFFTALWDSVVEEDVDWPSDEEFSGFRETAGW